MTAAVGSPTARGPQEGVKLCQCLPHVSSCRQPGRCSCGTCSWILSARCLLLNRLYVDHAGSPLSHVRAYPGQVCGAQMVLVRNRCRCSQRASSLATALDPHSSESVSPNHILSARCCSICCMWIYHDITCEFTAAHALVKCLLDLSGIRKHLHVRLHLNVDF